jgi:Synergist-CTERM protein sorting domain-containing protein
VKKFLCTVLLVAAALVVFQAPAMAIEKDSADGYYMISNAAEFKEFAGLVRDGNTRIKGKLTANISFGSGTLGDWAENYMIGPDFDKRFAGVLDGKGHEIQVRAYRGSTDAFFGIVGYLGAGGVVKNLSVRGSLQSQGDLVGAIAGVNSGIIMNCLNAASVSGNDYVGGITGEVRAGRVINCVNLAAVTARNCAGGTAGMVEAGKIEGCFNSGTVKIIARGKVGGISALMKDFAGNEISDSVSFGTVTYNTGAEQRGGILGLKKGSSCKVNNCAWTNVAGYRVSSGIGYDEARGGPTNLGAAQKGSRGELPVASIILDSYEKRGESFNFKATAYPMESNEIDLIRLYPDRGLTLGKTWFENGVAGTVGSLSRDNENKNYSVKVTANEYSMPSVSFTVLGKGGSSGSGDSGGGGCSSGFAALALLAAVPLALRRKK